MDQDSLKSQPFFKFENLRVYYKAVDLSVATLSICDIAITPTDKMLAQDLYKSSVLVMECLSEGASTAKSEFVTLLQKARAAIFMCVNLSLLLRKRGVIDEVQENDLRNELMEMTKMTGALVTSLQNDTRGEVL